MLHGNGAQSRLSDWHFTRQRQRIYFYKHTTKIKKLKKTKNNNKCLYVCKHEYAALKRQLSLLSLPPSVSMVGPGGAFIAYQMLLPVVVFYCVFLHSVKALRWHITQFPTNFYRIFMHTLTLSWPPTTSTTTI